MNDKLNGGSEALEIDVQRLVAALWKKKLLLVVVSVVCAFLALAGTVFFVTPQYESSTMFYVNNNDVSIGDTSLSISSADLTASRNLVNTYVVILKTRETINMVIDYAGVNRSYHEVLGMISAAAVNGTEVFRVTVTCSDPSEAKIIADAIAYILPNRIKTIINGSYAEIVDNAVASLTPCSPNYTSNTLLGFVIGLVVTFAVVILAEILSITIRTQEDIQYTCNYPILTTVPDMEESSSKSRRGILRKKADNAPKTGREEELLIGGNVSFAASESYKLLRTKLTFSFSDESASRVVGVTSALSGEGKSLTSINLAYTLSQLDKKVVLIDCDMRCPVLSTRLAVKRGPGLSSYLSGQSEFEALIQKCKFKADPTTFDVMVAGRNPPNPVELLSSPRMSMLLEQLRQQYDYVILDFPPIGEVSDALAVSKIIDGMLLVVRQNCCNRLALRSAVRQLAYVGTKIVGVVYNCADDHSQGYNYGYGYGYGYARQSAYAKRYKRSYMAAATRSAKPADARQEKGMPVTPRQDADATDKEGTTE